MTSLQKFTDSERFYMKTAMLNTVLLAVLCLLSACAGSPPKKQVTAQVESNAVVIPPEAARQFQVAINLLGNNQIEQAEVALLSITKQYPQLAGPFANLGVLYSKQKQWDEAEKYYFLAIEKNDKNAKVYNLLGVNYRQQGHFQQAEKYYRMGMQADPSLPDSYLNLGILYDIYLGKLEKAVLMYKKYQTMQVQPDKRVTGWLVDIQRRIGKKDQLVSEAAQ